MKLQQRRNFFMIFAIFFVVCTPIILIYSSGFNINFRNTEIKSNLSIKVDTKPNGAVVNINNKPTGSSPIEFGVAYSNIVDISIQKDNFVEEKFGMIGDKNKNTFADLTNLFLLPKLSEKVFKPQLNQPELPSILEIISESQLLINNKGSIEIQDFVLSGAIGNSQLILQNPVDGGKNIIKSDLSPEIITRLITPSNVITGSWQKLDQDYFYRDNLILAKKYDYWLVVDISKLNIIANQIVKLDSSNLLILDSEKKLWIYNTQTKINTFFDQGFENISSMPFSIWLWKGDTIYKLENKAILNKKLSISDYIYLKNDNISGQLGREFVVQNLFQGVTIQIGELLYYVPDYKSNEWQLMASDVKVSITENETIFWITRAGDLYTNNMYNNYSKFLAKGVDPNGKIGYNKEWKRIMFYYPNRVESIWYNKDSISDPIYVYSKQNWIIGQICYQKIVDKAQYCLQDNVLVVYKNSFIF